MPDGSRDSARRLRGPGGMRRGGVVEAGQAQPPVPGASCPECRTRADAGAAFCTRCGHALGPVCASCTERNPSDARFCRRCGAALDAATGAPPPEAAALPPARGPELSAASSRGIEGERKHLTVLFVDVVGSVQLAASVGPEAWHEIVDGFLQLLTEGVHRFDGTVEHHTGDGIMALFG